MINSRVTVQVPASSANLGPGFDSVSLALTLYNQVEMGILPEGCQIKVEGEGSGEISIDDSNLVYQAARKVFSRIRVHPTGLYIHLTNEIPLSSGLGSSAAAIVGGMVAANALCGNQLPAQDILNMAAAMEEHPDNVAPALMGGLTVAVEEAEEIVALRVDPPHGLIVHAAVPAFPLATKKSREVLPREVTHRDAVFSIGRASLLIAAMTSGQLGVLRTAMADRLHQPYREQLVPGLRDVMAGALEAGALGVALSGSGPSVIALNDKSEKGNMICSRMRQAFRQHQLEVRIYTLAPDKLGACLIDYQDGGTAC